MSDEEQARATDEGMPEPAEPEQAEAEAPTLAERAEAADAVLPNKQVTYPVTTAQVLRGGPNGRVLVVHAPGESLIFPWPQGLCDDIGRDLTSRVDVSPATDLDEVKKAYAAAQARSAARGRR